MGLTIAERDQTEGRATKDTRVDVVQLRVNDTVELSVPRCALAVGRARHDTIDVLRVARVRAVGDGVGDQGICVRDVRRLREVDHRVGVVLLGAGVGVREESVDTVDTGEVDAWLASVDVTAARELDRIAKEIQL